jgi:hypothetical protein
MSQQPETTTPEQPASNARFLLISLGILVGLLIISSFFIDLGEAFSLIFHANWPLVGVGVLFLLVGILLIDFRWWYLLARIPRFWRVFHASNVSFIVPILSPIPNTPIRVVTTGVATKATIPQATTAMVIERSIAQIMRLTAIILAVQMGAQVTLTAGYIVKTVAMALGIIGLFLLAMRYADAVVRAVDALLKRLPFIKEETRIKIAGMVAEALVHGGSMKEMIIATGMTLVMWSIFFIFHLLVILAMPIDLPLIDRMTIAMGALALTPPSAPAMFGIYHASQILPMLALNLGPLEVLLPYSLLLYFIQAIVWLILTLWGLRKLDMRFADLFRISSAIKEEEAEYIDDAESTLS